MSETLDPVARDVFSGSIAEFDPDTAQTDRQSC
jgi:hypothetical protein